METYNLRGLSSNRTNALPTCHHIHAVVWTALALASIHPVSLCHYTEFRFPQNTSEAPQRALHTCKPPAGVLSCLPPPVGLHADFSPVPRRRPYLQYFPQTRSIKGRYSPLIGPVPRNLRNGGFILHTVIRIISTVGLDLEVGVGQHVMFTIIFPPARE